MELKNILSGLEGLKARGNLDISISKVESNSSKVQKDDMFIAIDGFEQDGHQFIQEAIQNGAKVIMAQKIKLLKK